MSQSQSNTSIRVLHIDDEPDFAEMAAELLEREDDRLTVETATSAQEGLNRLTDAIDCIVSDYDMPGQNGIEFLKTVRAEYPDLPFILFTGKGSEAVASDAISAGVTDYLQKESGTEQYELLANRITNTVAQARAEQEAQRQRDRFQVLFENFPEPTIAYVYEDGEPYVAQVNEAFTDVFGYGPEDAVGEHIDDLIVPPERRPEAERLDERVKAGEPVDEILRRQARDGIRDFWFRNLRLPDDSSLDGYAIYADITERRGRERELERQNELFRKAQDIAAVGAWEYDFRTEDLTWTEEVYKIHGLSTAFDPTPETAIEFYHPDDRATIREAFNRAIEDGEPYDLELRLITESGEERWVRTRGDPHTDDGSVVRVRGTIQDITERKTADERLRALTNSFPDLAFIIDEDGHHVEHIAGPDSQALLVAEAETLIGQCLHDVMPADRADELLGVVRETLATGEPQSIEYQLDVKAGTTWFEARTAPLRTRIDGKRAVTWVARDISDRKEREQVLRELHAIATDLPSVENPAAICQRTVDAAESVLEFDNCVVYLAEDGELRVTALSEAFPAEDFTSMPIEGSLAGESYRTGESFVVDDADSHPIADPQGPYASGVSVPIGEHGVCQMIAKPDGAFDAEDLELAELLVSHTEQALDRLTREAELREQNSRLDEFVSIVSHDLRNPLNVAQGRLELASEECASEHLEDAATAVDRSLTLIEELLTLARQGEQVGDVEPVDLAATVESCWRTVDTANATLVTETERTIHADQNRLKQLLENLFRNAVEHGDEGVTITVGDLDDGRGFYVADDGLGIPEADREEIFEPGYSTTATGTGFGLNIVREIAEAHGWDITVTESDAGGARFEITGVERVE